MAYGKRVTSLPTIPEISPAQKVLGRTYTLWKVTVQIKLSPENKIVSSTAGKKKSRIDSHTQGT